ncbi:MAG TPA: hypothetical protein VL727_26720 [Puia sp.]|nr:hypothetical protein [Puia sp.]
MKTINPSSLIALKTLTLALVALLPVTAAEAQTAANWNFNSSLAAAAGSNITAPNVSLGSSIVSNAFNGGGEFYGQDGWPTGAIDPNAYLQFSVSPNTGYYLVLNTVTMVIRRSNTGTPQGAGPNNWILRSSLDGYTANLSTNSLTYNYATFTVTLPAAFQTLSSAVTFRLYGYNTTINSGGNSRLVADNISIQGQAISGVLAVQSLELFAKANGNGSSDAGANVISLQYQAQGFEAGTTYNIERSVDDISFTTINSLISNTADGTFFQYTDAGAPAVARVFYRVAAQQPDGTILRSGITVVNLVQKGAALTTIRSVVAGGGSVKTQLSIGEAGSYQLSIFSPDGRALYHQVINAPAGDQTAQLSAGNYPHGVYVLTLSKNGVNTSRQFLY